MLLVRRADVVRFAAGSEPDEAGAPLRALAHRERCVPCLPLAG